MGPMPGAPLQMRAPTPQLAAGTFPVKAKRIGRRLKWDWRDVDRYLDRLPTIN